MIRVVRALRRAFGAEVPARRRIADHILETAMKEPLPPPAFQRARRTRSERRLLEQLEDDGVAWVVPSQFRMVRRLAAEGLVDFRQDLRHYDPVRGSVVHAVLRRQP